MKKNIKNIKLEEALDQLNRIANKIEDKSISIDEMIELFEEGTKLTLICKNKIEEAEKKVILLSDLIKDK